MNYEIKSLSQVEKQITVQVPKQAIDSAINAVITGKRETLDEKGFRDEKIPDSLIFEKLKGEILSLAVQQIFEAESRKAVAFYGIAPLNQIEMPPDISLERGQDCRFCFVVELIPELEIPEFEGVEIEVQEAVVSEADIDQIIDSVREQLSTLEEINEDRQAADGDVALFDFESQGRFLNMMGMSGTHLVLEIGADQMVADFEKILKTLKPGQSKTGIITYPADFPNPSLAGQKVQTKITLNTLKQKILPEINEELARKVAQVGSVIEMRMILLQQHRRRLTYHYEQDARTRLLDRLLQKTDVPLAPSYVSDNLEEMIGQYATTMQQRGMTLAEIAKQTPVKKREFLPEAESAAKRQLFLLAIAEKEQLKLDPQELQQEIAHQAETVKTDVTQFLQDAQQSGLIRTIEDALMMRKVMDLLFEKAKKRQLFSMAPSRDHDSKHA